MATTLIPLRTDQAAATQAAALKSLAITFRNAYYELQKTRDLMRGGFDDANPAAINWDLLEELWGAPVADIGGEPPGKVLWDMVNGALIVLDGNGGNNDFQKLIDRIV
jgi:hypothetical protein